jgi:signal transduction histidine kinase
VLATAERNLRVASGGMLAARERRISAAQLDAIMAVSAAVAQGAALGETLNQIAQTAAKLVSAQAAAIVLREGDVAKEMTIAGSHGLGERYPDDINATRPLEMGKGPSGIAAETGRPVCVEDVLVEDIFGPWRGFAERERYRAVLCVPLRLEDERVIGVLNVYRATPGAWDSHDVDLASLLADHAAIAIRTADLLDRSRRQVDGLSLIVRSLRAQAHEHANRLHAIYGLLVLDEPDEARRLIATVEDGYHSTYGTVTGRVENPTIAGLLVAEAAIARESGIDLALDRRSHLGQLPAALTDLDAVTILGNLLHNAVEAVSTAPRSRRRVRVAFQQRDAETKISVRDWGPGVSPDQLERILDRDYSTKQGHAGLGLHLVKTVVTRTGGKLSLERMRPTGLQAVVTYTS